MTKKRTKMATRGPLEPTNDVAAIVSTKAFEHLAEALGVYLDAVGWRVLVVDTPRVQQQPGERALNYEFVVRFTGGRKKS